MNRAQVRAGPSVAVIGCGGVGLNVIQGAALQSAGTIIAVDLHDDKLALARSFGATASIDASAVDDVPAAIIELTGGAGADYVFEVVGRPELVRQGWDSLLHRRHPRRHRRGTLDVGGRRCRPASSRPRRRR